MPRLVQTVTQTVEPEPVVELTPRQHAALTLNLATYAGLKAQLDETKQEMALLVGELELVRAETGQKSVGLEGYGKVTEVPAGENSKLDVKKLLAQGVTLNQITKATVKTPRAGYTKVTVPEEKE